jgi:hypothetical protein
MVEVGISRVRIGEFAWSRIEPDTGRFDWYWLDRFKECLDRGVFVTVAFATHRWSQALGLQLLLIFMGTVLAAAIRMEDAAFGGLPQVCRHIERPDCQILLHSVTDRPANDTATVQIKNDGKVEPTLGSPYTGDSAGPHTKFMTGPQTNMQPKRTSI